MATLNLVLDTRRLRKDGTYPLVFRIRLGRVFKDIATGFTVKENLYDYSTNTIINNNTINHQLEQLRNHYYMKLHDYMVLNVGYENLNDIKDHLVNKSKEEITIYDFWHNENNKLIITKKMGNARVHKTTLNVISSEINLNIPFRKFAYKDLLDLELKLYNRGLAVNGVSVYLRTFKAICNKAINLDYVDLNWYPFRKFKIKKEKTIPRVLTLMEVRDYFNLDIKPNNPNYQSWLIGKLIFLLRGINLKDLLLLKTTDIKEGRIIYRRAKTGKMYSIKIHSEIKKILVNFTPNVTFLGILSDEKFHDPRIDEIQAQMRKVINRNLIKLGKMIGSKEEITTYVFRYTYANIAKQIGVPNEVISELLGHQYGNAVTGIYLELFENDKLDKYNDQICKAVTNN